jgi:hypothetical protein
VSLKERERETERKREKRQRDKDRHLESAIEYERKIKKKDR